MMDIDKPNQDEVSEKQETPSPLDMFNIDTHSPIAAIPVSNNTDVLKDARYLFRTLMTFLKSVIFGLKNCNPPVPPQPTSSDPNKPRQQVNYDKWNDSAKLIAYEEVNILRALFRGGISCLRFFPSPNQNHR